MDDERAQAWAYAFGLIAAADPRASVDRSMAAAWDAALADLTPQQIKTGALRMIAESRYYSPAALKDGALGKLKKIPVYATDVWGRRILSSSGEPRVERWEERREHEGHSALPPGQQALPENSDEPR